MAKWQRRSGIMLAYPFDLGRVRRNFTPPLLVQPKLNGERCRVLIDKEGKVTLLSSEENAIISMPHIVEAFQKTKLRAIELDGELYNHTWSLQKIHSAVSRKNNLHDDHGEIEFHCFDLILDGVHQWERLNLLYRAVKCLFPKGSPLKVIETTPCGAVEEAEALLNIYMEEGYEGIIIREHRALYQRKRVTTMLKWKPRKSDCYAIVGYKEEIDQHGEPKNALGAIICETDGETFAIGSGPLLTREVRENLWQDRDALIGQYAVIRYPELTDRGIPSHPVVVEISPVYVEDNYDD